jgi:methylenetetrahydrofolate reductase (NADPH)
MTAGRIAALLSDVNFEIVPLKGALEVASILPAKSVVTVVASPSRGIEATVDLAVALAERGYEAVPHLSARMIKDRPQLASITDRLSETGVDHVFVVGGDAKEAGAYVDALSLLRAMEDEGHTFQQVGIAGYPEGHPSIDDDTLLRAMRDKERHATYIATQMCFDAQVITGWVEGMRRQGVTLPVKVGVPGAVTTAKLATVAARIGVGDSLRYLAKGRGSVLGLLRPGPYDPNTLLGGITRHGHGLGIEGLHIFTFNQVAETLDWFERATDL